jgi:four helix bundle protein
MPNALTPKEESDLGHVIDHENLVVYQLAFQFAVDADAMVKRIDKSGAHLADQFRRASSSIPPNIAEGSAKMGVREKAHPYRIARGSATESAACLDLLHRLGHITIGEFSGGKTLVRRIVGALINLAKSVEER